MLLTDIKTEKRIGMQVFYSTDEKGTKKQYAGVVVGESNNRYASFGGRARGRRGRVSSLLPTTNAQFPHPDRIKTRGNVTKLATGTVTVADLTEERLLSVSQRCHLNAERNWRGSRANFIEAKDNVPYFVVDPNESIKITPANRDRFIVRVGIDRSARLEGSFEAPARITENIRRAT